MENRIQESLDKFLEGKRTRGHGNEIQVELCPFCQGGHSHEKYSFHININTGLYNCKRQSCCKSGIIGELPKNANIQYTKKEYQIPELKGKTNDTCIDYFKSRGISKEIVDSFRVKSGGNSIEFAYYDENNELTHIKYRGIKEKTFSASLNSKQILFGMWRIEPAESFIYITEGEFDAMAMAQAGINNVVSVPMGAGNLNWIENCIEWLDRFGQIIIWPDNDEPGKKMLNLIADRLGRHRVYYIDCTEFKDANECLLKSGESKLIEIASGQIKDFPNPTIEEYDPWAWRSDADIERVYTGWSQFDSITEGFRYGEFSVWTGINGEGKTTFLNHLLVKQMIAGNRIMIYSGENTMRTLAKMMNLQIYSEILTDSDRFKVFGQSIPILNDNQIQNIENVCSGNIFRYRDDIEGANMLESFEYAFKKFGIRIFLVDNLMTATTKRRSSSNFYQDLNTFIDDIRKLTLRYSIHVHIVCHPRKTDKTQRIKKEDIAGMSDIANMAHNIYSVERDVTIGKNDFEKIYPCVVQQLKCRFNGNIDQVAFNFNPNDRRYTPVRIEK
jgi:twinkle protein